MRSHSADPWQRLFTHLPRTHLLGIPVNRGNGNTLLRERYPPMGYKVNSEAPGEPLELSCREWEMSRKLAAEQRKEIARKAAKAPWDEKRREEP
jgi:hypothetical protein